MVVYCRQGCIFERHPGAMVSYNSSFIQIVMNGSRRDGMQERFRELYEVYLKNEKVYPVTQQSDFGLCDGSGKPDWMMIPIWLITGFCYHHRMMVWQ